MKPQLNRRRISNLLLLGSLAALLLSVILALRLRANLPGDWPRSVRISCKNNLYQIAKAIRMWGMDNQDTYPYSLSTNTGGTLEFCARNAEGFDNSSFIHFQVMSNELGSPRVVVCPQDRSKRPATDFARLKAENVSYRLRTGTNVSEAHPSEVLAVCPIHGNFLRCDGSLTEVKGEPEPWWFPYKDLFDYDAKVQLSCYRILRTLGASLLLLLAGAGLRSSSKLPS